MEGTFVKKLAILASAATALLCAASLVVAPAEAKSKHKKPAAAPVAVVSNAGPSPNGSIGPAKNAGMCWGNTTANSYESRGFGYWKGC